MGKKVYVLYEGTITLDASESSVTLSCLSTKANITVLPQDIIATEEALEISKIMGDPIELKDLTIFKFNSNNQLPVDFRFTRAGGKISGKASTAKVYLWYSFYLNGEPEYFNKYKTNGTSIFKSLETNWYRDECAPTLTTGGDYQVYKKLDGNVCTFNNILFAANKQWHNTISLDYKNNNSNIQAVKQGYLPQNFYLSQADADNITVNPGDGGYLLNKYIMIGDGSNENNVLIQKKYDDNNIPYIYCDHVVGTSSTPTYHTVKNTKLIITGTTVSAKTTFKTLGYIPNLLTVTLGGAGGGGAGGSSNNGGGGGGGIAVTVINVDISNYKIVLGKYGDGGANNTDGKAGESSKIYALAYSSANPVCVCYGGGGGTHGTSSSKLGQGGAGGKIYYPSVAPYCYLAKYSYGGTGGKSYWGRPPESEQANELYCGYSRDSVIFGMVSDELKNSTIARALGGLASYFGLAAGSAGGGGASLGWGGGRNEDESNETGNLGGGGKGAGNKSYTGATGGRSWCVITY